MVKYNSIDLTLKDIERIDKYGAHKASKKYGINYDLAKSCENKLIQKGGSQTYSGKRNLRKFRDESNLNDSSETRGMKELLESESDFDQKQMSQVSQASQMSQMFGNPMMSPAMNMMSPQQMQMQNPYVHNFDLSNTQTVNVNPATNQQNPNLSLNGNTLQPINNMDVMNNIVNNPNPNMFQMNQPNMTGALPPKQEQMDPLMMNTMVPVISPQQMLSNLKQLNAI